VPAEEPPERRLRAALSHLHDLPYLQTHPFGGRRGKELRRRIKAGELRAERVQRPQGYAYLVTLHADGHHPPASAGSDGPVLAKVSRSAK